MLSDDVIRELRTLRDALSVVIAGADDTEPVIPAKAAEPILPPLAVTPGAWPARLYQLTLVPCKGGYVNAYFYTETEAELVREWLEESAARA